MDWITLITLLFALIPYAAICAILIFTAIAIYRHFIKKPPKDN